MPRVYNFNPGPATLPEAVLKQAQDELLNWQGQGLSVLEISHHDPAFLKMVETAEADFRELLAIPENYKVLFLQGGARSQFSMVPLNLLRGKTSADYLDVGIWSKMALTEASRYCNVNIVASGEKQNYISIPEESSWHCDPNAAYLHYADNETVNGLEFSKIPKITEVPLVADMSSNILSRAIDISRFGLIYASAQKNAGPAGLTLVIVREDLLGQALPITPTMFNYKVHADAHSIYNTPPTFIWYMVGLTFKWLKQQGGVSAIEKINQRKSEKLYHFIDNNDFYSNPVDKRYRSRMNVVFRLANENLNALFLQEANAAGLAGLKGHKLVGGMRASIYNPMPEAGIDALISFMQDFARRNG
ncbi:MAG TPA: 3-phosphoserine/phosphohydroxythreonine transaminase [Gammaproteobacteria bacterium]|nr:3-phosphoserine/phosphohydroxythreonine transaminase [Gammaproteobacteria bacterium]